MMNLSENEKTTVQAASASRMNMRREARNQLVFLSAQFLLGMAVNRRPVRSAVAPPEPSFPNADPGTRDATAQPVIRIGDDDQHRSRAIGEVMEMTRTTVKITAAAVCATLVSMLFVGSNVGAPLQPVPHPLPVGVAGPAVAARVRS